LAFPFFGKKTGDSAGGGGKDPAGKPAQSAPSGFDPAKAEIFFVQARVKQETGSFAYALHLWLSGLRLDPNNLPALQAYFECVRASGLTQTPKDLKGVVDGPGPVLKALSAIMNWSFRQGDGELAVRAAVGVAELSLRDVSVWVAPRALAVVMEHEAKPRKDQFIRLMQVFIANEQYDYANNAGQGALNLDPGDFKLSNDLRDLAAMATMSKGGYEDNNQQGGFRKNIRDQDRQKQLDENERLTKSVSTLDRNVERTKGEYEASPTDKPTILAYIQALFERKSVEDWNQAIAVAERAYEQTQEYRFKHVAGEVRVKLGQLRLKKLKEKLVAAPDDASVRSAFLDQEAKQLELEIEQLQGAVQAYPTDLAKKFDLGQRYILAGRFEEAIAQLQQSKGDGRYKAQSLASLARCFKQIGWMDEAVGTLRQAVENHADPNDAGGLELRYELCVCLLAKGAQDKDLASAEEADRLASAIAVQNIMFKDVREVRGKIKGVIAGIKGG